MYNNSGILYRPWKQLKRLQEEKLRYFLTRQLYPFSPHYRSLFDKHKIKPGDIKTVKDLQRVPFTSKEDFLAASDKGPSKKSLDFLLQPDDALIKKYLPRVELAKFIFLGLLRGKDYLKGRLQREYRPIFLTATAGTTKEPVSFLYTSYDLENLKLYGRRIIEIFGITQSDRAVNVFPYAPHLAFWQTFFAGVSSNVFILSTGGGKTLGTEGNVRSILKVRPKFLIGVPSYVYHILKAAKEQGLNLSFLSRIALGAARVPRGFKRKISSLLAEMGSPNAQVLGTYGFTEARCAWAECPTGIDISSGYHTYPDKEVFEIIDPGTGQARREGEDGEIVYTGIGSRGSCVLRYRTGDLVKGGIVYSPCPHCKRTVPRISSDIARASDIKDIRLSKIKGALVNLNSLQQILDDRQEIDEWQIEIAKKDNDPFEVDELTLYVSLLKDVNKGEFCAALNDEVFSVSEVSFNDIKVVSHKEIKHRIEVETSMKAKKIVDRRPET